MVAFLFTMRASTSHGMDRAHAVDDGRHDSPSSVVVHNFNVLGIAAIPNKAHTPRVVDADAVRYAQIIQSGCPVPRLLFTLYHPRRFANLVTAVSASRGGLC